MQIYSQLAPLALGGAHGSAVAMGFFDGIHIGHRAVINGAVEWARAHGAAPAVFTFRLPTENKMKGKRLLSTEDKHALIASLGVEHYLCPDFEEIKAMTPEQFAAVAAPYIRQTVKNPTIDPAQIAPLLQQRCEVLTDIPEKVDFFDALPEYDITLYTNKKSKTDPAVSLEMLKTVRPLLAELPAWDDETLLAAMKDLAERLEVKNAKVMWPVRIAVSGRAVTPGGAVEICRILGRDETLRRIDAGIAKLEG